MKIRLYLSAFAKPPMSALIMVSVVAWLALFLNSHSMHGSGHHQMVDHGVMHMLLQSAWPWFLMLLAMMSPLLGGAIKHLWVRSLSRRRIRAITLFVVGYITVWMLAGAVLLLGAEQLNVLSAFGWFAAPATGLLIVFAWQASPLRQMCLNRCHWTARLSAFGLRADWDCLRFGLIKGCWCVGSCWALMFLPLLFPSVHLPLMLLVTFYLFFEQYQPARPPQWRLPLLAKAFS